MRFFTCGTFFFNKIFSSASKNIFFQNFENSISELSYALSKSVKKYLKLAILSTFKVMEIWARLPLFGQRKKPPPLKSSKKIEFLYSFLAWEFSKNCQIAKILFAFFFNQKHVFFFALPASAEKIWGLKPTREVEKTKWVSFKKL